MTVKGLLVMDVDSTLIRQEVIDLLGEKAGQKDIISDITERAMRGELDFAQALAERVNLLKGLPDTIFDEVRREVTYTPGARELIEELHRQGYKVGLVSGGFHEIVDKLVAELGIDYACANRLEVINRKLTGKTTGPIVTKDTKVACLKQWAKENNLDLTQTIAMGDGANDLPMIATAGLGVAFCAKPIVREQAPYQINEPNLYHLIHLIEELQFNH